MVKAVQIISKGDFHEQLHINSKDPGLTTTGTPLPGVINLNVLVIASDKTLAAVPSFNTSIAIEYPFGGKIEILPPVLVFYYQ